MIAEGPLPHRVQGRSVALQVRGENTDADHVAEPAARRSQDGLQVGEELLGLGFSGVREVPRPRIDPEKCGHENPSVHLDCLGNRALVGRSVGPFLSFACPNARTHRSWWGRRSGEWEDGAHGYFSCLRWVTLDTLSRGDGGRE